MHWRDYALDPPDDPSRFAREHDVYPAAQRDARPLRDRLRRVSNLHG